MALRFAYNTNGTANHRFDDALSLIADTGYQGVALTLDHHHFDPFTPHLSERADQLAARLSQLSLGLVLETGARYLLNPRHKHEPTLISPESEGRRLRIDFLVRAMQIGSVCGAEALSFWAGVPRPGVTKEAALDYLRSGLDDLTRQAERYNVTLAFEPEPGMLIETIDDLQVFLKEFPTFRLALDTGHCLASGDRDPAAAVRETRDILATVSVEDMPRGVHEHLPFGEGDMDIPAVLTALQEIDFTRLVCVELSRDSHRAHTMVPQALSFLREAEKQIVGMAR